MKNLVLAVHIGFFLVGIGGLFAFDGLHARKEKVFSYGALVATLACIVAAFTPLSVTLYLLGGGFFVGGWLMGIFYLSRVIRGPHNGEESQARFDRDLMLGSPIAGVGIALVGIPLGLILLAASRLLNF
jgi:hypothetical protein